MENSCHTRDLVYSKDGEKDQDEVCVIKQTVWNLSGSHVLETPSTVQLYFTSTWEEHSFKASQGLELLAQYTRREATIDRKHYSDAA